MVCSLGEALIHVFISLNTRFRPRRFFSAFSSAFYLTKISSLSLIFDLKIHSVNCWIYGTFTPETDKVCGCWRRYSWKNLYVNIIHHWYFSWRVCTNCVSLSSSKNSCLCLKNASHRLTTVFILQFWQLYCSNSSWWDISKSRTLGHSRSRRLRQTSSVVLSSSIKFILIDC